MARRSRAPQTILLVDPDPALRTIAQLHLAAPDVEIAEAGGEGEARATMIARRVHVAIARLHGAGWDGLAFLEQLRRATEPSVRGVPVLLVAQAVAGEEQRRIADLAPARILAAPITGPRLVAAVSKLFAAK